MLKDGKLSVLAKEKLNQFIPKFASPGDSSDNSVLQKSLTGFTVREAETILKCVKLELDLHVNKEHVSKILEDYHIL
jgi:hypothetical protein